MQDGGFPLFKGIENGLGLFLGLVQLGEQGFYARDNAFLLIQRRQGKFYLCRLRA